MKEAEPGLPAGPHQHTTSKTNTSGTGHFNPTAGQGSGASNPPQHDAVDADGPIRPPWPTVVDQIQSAHRDIVARGIDPELTADEFVWSSWGEEEECSFAIGCPTILTGAH